MSTSRPRSKKECGRLQDTDSFIVTAENPTSPRATRHRKRLLSAESSTKSDGGQDKQKKAAKPVVAKKKAAEPSVVETKNVEPAAEEKKVHKKRGRKSKLELLELARLAEEAKEEAKEEEKEEAQPKKKRGRKPKNQKPSVAAEPEASGPSEAPSAPNKSVNLNESTPIPEDLEQVFNNGIVNMRPIFHPQPEENEKIEEILEKYREYYHETKEKYDELVQQEIDTEFAKWLDGDPLEMEAKRPETSIFAFTDSNLEDIAGFREVFIGDEKEVEKSVRKETQKTDPEEEVEDLQCVPCTRIETGDTIPEMMYYVTIQTSIYGRDQPRLTHMPFFGDNQNDKELFVQLAGLFPDGIHGFACNYKHVNDYLLYSVMRKALEARPENPDLVYYGIYRMWPNKLSQAELTAEFPDLCARFGEQNFDPYSLEPWKERPQNKVAENSRNLKCYPCFQKICPAHGFRREIPKHFSNGDYHKVLLPLHANTVPTRYCSARCWKQIPLVNVMPILNPDDEECEKLELMAYVKKQKLNSASIEDGSFLVTRFVEARDKEETFCQFVARSLDPNLTGSKATTCLEAYQLIIKFVERPDAPYKQLIEQRFAKQNSFKARFDMFRSIMHQTEKRRKQMALERKRAEAIKDGLDVEKVVAEYEEKLEKDGPGLEAVTPFTTCQHEGRCSTELCACRENGVCSSLCNCDINCPQRFPGCACAPGQCGSRACQCFRARWECSPDTCATCNCSKQDSKEKGCMNYGMSRMAQKKVTVAPSAVAGNGLFLLEACEKDEFVIEYVGERISDEEAERRGAIYDRYNCSYIFNLETGGAIDSYHAGNLSRFANHSDEKSATLYARTMVVAGEHRIGFYASRALAVNDELTFNYSYSGEHKKVVKGKVEVPKSTTKAKKKTSI